MFTCLQSAQRHALERGRPLRWEGGMTIDEALLMFNKWWSECTPITCTYVGKGFQMRITGMVENIDAGTVVMHNREDDAFLRMPLHSVHQFRYCDPREVSQPETDEEFVAFLIMSLADGNVVQFAEPK
jgi:hypothetical protein